MPMTWRCTFLLLLLGWLPRAAALAPHELLLAINQNSPPSLELANRYAALRGLPPEKRGQRVTSPDSRIDGKQRRRVGGASAG